MIALTLLLEKLIRNSKVQIERRNVSLSDFPTTVWVIVTGLVLQQPSFLIYRNLSRISIDNIFYIGGLRIPLKEHTDTVKVLLGLLSYYRSVYKFKMLYK